MIKNPLHPAAAQLLIDFYLSAEGQRGLSAAGKIPLRRGVKSSVARDRSTDGDRQFPVILPEGSYDRYMKIYNDYLAFGDG